MRISTIIPAYNRAALIGETLRSVLEQDRPPDEIVVVDDGSSDGTADAVAAFGSAVTLLRQANAGAGAARNAGFAASTGDAVQFMDSDDLVVADFLGRSERALGQGAEMTCAPWLKTRIAGRALDPEPFVLQQGPPALPGPLPHAVLSLRWLTVLQPCLLRRGLVERAGPYRSDLAPSEDMEFLYRLTSAAKAVAHAGDTLVLYRTHPEEQISHQNPTGRLRDLVSLWRHFERHAAARDDMDAAERRRFRRSKYAVARSAAQVVPDAAQALARDATALDRALHLPAHLLSRVAARWQVLRTGNPYPAPFAAAPLTPGQRASIARLGYALPAAGDAG